MLVEKGITMPNNFLNTETQSEKKTSGEIDKFPTCLNELYQNNDEQIEAKYHYCKVFIEMSSFSNFKFSC